MLTWDMIHTLWLSSGSSRNINDGFHPQEAYSPRVRKKKKSIDPKSKQEYIRKRYQGRKEGEKEGKKKKKKRKLQATCYESKSKS